MRTGRTRRPVGRAPCVPGAPHPAHAGPCTLRIAPGRTSHPARCARPAPGLRAVQVGAASRGQIRYDARSWRTITPPRCSRSSVGTALPRTRAPIPSWCATGSVPCTGRDPRVEAAAPPARVPAKRIRRPRPRAAPQLRAPVDPARDLDPERVRSAEAQATAFTGHGCPPKGERACSFAAIVRSSLHGALGGSVSGHACARPTSWQASRPRSRGVGDDAQRAAIGAADHDGRHRLADE